MLDLLTNLGLPHLLAGVCIDDGIDAEVSDSSLAAKTGPRVVWDESVHVIHARGAEQKHYVDEPKTERGFGWISRALGEPKKSEKWTRSAVVHPHKSRSCTSSKGLEPKASSWDHLDQTVLYQSWGACRLWEVIAQRRIQQENATALECLDFAHKDRISVVVTVSSHQDDIECLWRLLQCITEEEKEIVVVEAHGQAPNPKLEAWAREDERFVHIPVRVHPPPSSALGKAVGTVVASGEYVIRTTIHDVLAAETLKSPLQQRHRRRLRARVLLDL